MSLISVVIPTYNRREYVALAIDSVLAQTVPEVEIIVVDDGSTDQTGEALHARYGDRIAYVYQSNQGESAARNLGLKLSSGDFIALLDSDDVWLPKKLENQLAVLQREPDIGAVFCSTWLIDSQGNRLAEEPVGRGLTSQDFTLERLTIDNDLGGPSAGLFRRSVLEQVGGFDEAIQYGEDWDLWLRIAAQARIAFLDEPLVCLRRHRGTQSYYPTIEKNARRLREHLVIVEKALAHWPGAVPAGLREATLARRYVQAYLSDAAINNEAAAHAELLELRSIKPAVLHDTDVFGQLIIDHAALLAEDGTRASLPKAVTFVAQVMDQIREVGEHDAVFSRQVTAHAYATLGFIARRAQHRDLARLYFWQALKRDARWRRNRGVVSSLVQTLVGKSITTSVRKLAGKSTLDVTA